ncbi:hypothetical protein HWHPT5561_06670 [Petrotoga sp. HWH.PT.55.6.1]|nr:hypothetical protein X926_07980 [Petrotoga sp. HWHPT.55.6.3]RPD35606.1 hypothetical protein HWHPT5561_06670 [Petrotoga sp. HWH.PT.55.6.1]
MNILPSFKFFNCSPKKYKYPIKVSYSYFNNIFPIFLIITLISFLKKILSLYYIINNKFSPYIAPSLTNLNIDQKSTEFANLCSTVENIKTQPIKKTPYTDALYISQQSNILSKK